MVGSRFSGASVTERCTGKTLIERLPSREGSLSHSKEVGGSAESGCGRGSRESTNYPKGDSK